MENPKELCGSFRIEAAKPEDETIFRLAELEKECFSCPWSEESFKKAASDELFFLPILYDGGTPIGYAVLFSLFETAEIQNIAVKQDYRGRGFGKMLLERCVRQAKEQGAEQLFLEVRESNRPALSLYEKAGFSTVGRRRNYYREPLEDALVM